ncbi:MAG: PLP-dependent cysteine synthase family protein [Anaerolineales bacterium]
MTLVNFLDVRLNILQAGGIEDHVGNTPLIRLRRVTRGLSPAVQVFAKAEWFNPGGSIKDRPALNILRAALADGSLDGGRRLLDSTSGNMGIAYATFGAALGIPVTLTIPGNASPERLSILRALGAQLVLTDPLEGSDGAQVVAKHMVAERPDLYFYANQYDNPANWQAHYQSTGPEIVAQTEGRVTHFVAGLGTTGTLTGTGRYLKDYNAAIELVALQPDAPFHALEGLKHLPSAIQPGIFNPSLPDRTLEIGSEAAREMVRRLAGEEGLFVGVSAGAAAVGALQVAAQLESGVVVTVFPDAGYKYLSDSRLWSDDYSI